MTQESIMAFKLMKKDITSKKRKVYKKEDLIQLLNKDEEETIEELNNAYSSTKTLFENFRHNSLNFLDYSIQNKNLAVFEFIISHSELLIKPKNNLTTLIIQFNFFESIEILDKYDYHLSLADWNRYLKESIDSKIILKILNKYPNLLSDLKRDEVLEACVLASGSMNFLDPITLCKKEFSEKQINKIWSEVLEQQSDVLKHQFLIDNDVFPTTLFYNNKPLLIFILLKDNLRMFDFYYNNEIILKQSVDYINELNNINFLKFKSSTNVTHMKKVFKLLEKTKFKSSDYYQLLPEIENCNFYTIREVENFLIVLEKTKQLHYAFIKNPEYLEKLKDKVILKFNFHFDKSKFEVLLNIAEKTYLDSQIIKVKKTSVSKKRL